MNFFGDTDRDGEEMVWDGKNEAMRVSKIRFPKENRGRMKARQHFDIYDGTRPLEYSNERPKSNPDTGGIGPGR